MTIMDGVRCDTRLLVLHVQYLTDSVAEASPGPRLLRGLLTTEVNQWEETVHIPTKHRHEVGGREDIWIWVRCKAIK